MLLQERLEFIDSLASLPTLITPRTFARHPDDIPPHDINKPTASVMPDTIDVFLPGISQETIDDVNLCKLVMQNAATKLYPDDAQLFEWYKYYVDGLKKLGWIIQNKDIQEVTINRVGLTMDQVALEVATSLIGGNAAYTLANVAKKAVETVQDNVKAIEIFNRNNKLGAQAKFDIAPVWVDANKQANMVLNCISLDARESTRGILFWKSTKQTTSIKTGAVRTYLDNKVFASLRDAIYSKYSEAGKKFIEELPDF
ncbi:hypothetical protein [Pseudomonas sp. NPDC089569]|uniref:hypothetical protein n=1 Tax=Pseudomonas sp. NPDC089569 TaxID=3390722 RepID=UPI003D019261